MAKLERVLRPRRCGLAAAAALALLAAIALSADPSPAAESSERGVAVVRGAPAGDAPTLRGVAVLRGSGTPEVVAPAPVETAAGPQAIAGGRLWLYDAQSGRLIGCRLANPVTVGAPDQVLCGTRRLGRTGRH